MRGRAAAPVMALLAVAAVAAATSPDFPARASYIIQLTGSQYASGLGEYLVPPLRKAFRRTGMRYDGSPAAQFAATVETGSDAGSWQGAGAARAWLYRRFVTVGLSPADVDIEPQGRPEPRFAVKVTLMTPDEDRLDELDCLIALATRELAARYRPEGRVSVNGQGCARK